MKTAINVIDLKLMMHNALSLRGISKSTADFIVDDYIEAELNENNFELSGKAIEEYTSMCATIGRTVYFSRGTEKLSGEAVAINDNSELLVMHLDGTIQTVNSGEVTVQGIY